MSRPFSNTRKVSPAFSSLYYLIGGSDPSLGGFGTWFPAHRKLYRSCLREQNDRNADLRPPLPATSFAASTINAGPQTTCSDHVDWPNLVYGICLDAVLGSFESSKGGHLILHEAKQVLKLGPGRIVLFPSACITHENIPIDEGEGGVGRRRMIIALTTPYF